MELKRNVVMLPTNEKASTNGLVINPSTDKIQYNDTVDKKGAKYYTDVAFTYNHIYITSDEAIGENDWFINTKTNKLHKCKQVNGDKIITDELDLHEPLGDCYYYFKKTESKKIIATTDNLTFDDGYNSWFIPSPSDDFIKKYIERYNAGNLITEVMVEHEYESGYQTIDPILEMNPILKVDKNNYITITAVKDSWTKDELDAVLNEFAVKCIKYALHGGLPSDAKAFTKSWIEQNL